MGRRRRREPDPPYSTAWAAFACPVVAWLSQVGMVLVFRNAAGLVLNLMAVVTQLFLILGGVFFGLSALNRRGDAGPGLIVPAGLGVVLSAGTLFLILLAIVGVVR